MNVREGPYEFWLKLFSNRLAEAIDREILNDYLPDGDKLPDLWGRLKKVGWIGVDLDGCLAHYAGWIGPEFIGEPVPEMLERVKRWLADGKDVRIFTARACVPSQIAPVEAWCKKHLGQVLPVTNVKDFGMITLYDDRCVRILTNRGIPCCRED